MSEIAAPDFTKGVMRRRTHAVIRLLLGGILRPLIRLKVTGTEHVPTEGPFILVSNHLHNADPVLIQIVSPRLIRFMAKSELFDVPVARTIIRWAGAFPIHRGKADRASIKRGQDLLKAGYPIGIFPEGGRSTAMKIVTIMPGAGLFAVRGDCPVVPMAVTGTERLPFNGKKQAKKHVARSVDEHRGVLIRFGEPFHVPAEIDGKRTNADAAARYMMTRVAEILPPEYRGILGDD